MAIRLRLLVETVRLIVMPANCRLLFPRMEDRHLGAGWGQGAKDPPDQTHTGTSSPRKHELGEPRAEQMQGC